MLLTSARLHCRLLTATRFFPRHQHVPALNNVPCFMRPLITTNLDDFISNEIPLIIIDQLETSRVVDSEFVNLLLHESSFLSLACARPRRKTQEFGSWVHIELDNFTPMDTRTPCDLRRSNTRLRSSLPND
jgi:hypothetical protein